MPLGWVELEVGVQSRRGHTWCAGQEQGAQWAEELSGTTFGKGSPHALEGARGLGWLTSGGSL